MKYIYRSGAGDESLVDVHKGVKKIADLVGLTLGPKGRLVACRFPVKEGHHVTGLTKDGVTVSGMVRGESAGERIGVEIMQEGANMTLKLAGDGTSSTIILAEQIINHAFALAGKIDGPEISNPINIVDIKAQIDAAVPKVVAEIAKLSTPIDKTSDDLLNIAVISCNGDRFIAGLITEAFSKVGYLDGDVQVEIVSTPECSVEVVPGMRIGTGYTHGDFANNPKRECVFENPIICIQQGDIWNTDGSVKVLEEAHKRNKPALILADDISGQMLETMLLNANKKKSGDPKGVACCAVRTPGGIEHRELLKDIAAMLDTEIIGPDTGLKINNVPMSIMGTCNKVIIDRESSTFYFTPCERLKNRIIELKAQYEAETDFDRKKSLHGRIAKLTSGMAIIKIGSISDTEKKERFDRADDAVNAVRCALEEGYLPGGGLSYIHASNVLDMNIPGERVLFYALQEITTRILRNAGIEDIFIQKLLEDTISENRLWNGYDINSDIMQDYDFKKAGVLDPAKVVRTVVQHASKIAGNLILTSGFISHSID